jgi:hypothetical protein
LIAAGCATSTAVLARVGSVVVLLSGTTNYSRALASHVLGLGASDACTSVGTIRLEKVLPPASITTFTSIPAGSHTCEMVPGPMPLPIMRPYVVANVWWHLLTFNVGVIPFLVAVLSLLARG